MATTTTEIAHKMESGQADGPHPADTSMRALSLSDRFFTWKSSFTMFSDSNLEPRSPKNQSMLCRLWSCMPNCGAASQSKSVRGHVIVQKLADYRKGYPRLAAFQCSDEGFMIYRKFGYLQSRVLLEKQDKLRVHEQELQELDEELYSGRNTWTQTRKHITDKELRSRRDDLMDRIAEAYCSYSNVLAAASQIVALNRPGKSDHRSVDSFMTDEPLAQEENKWIRHKEDLVTLRPGREHAWLDTGIEHLLRGIHCRFVAYLFCSAETKEKTEGRPNAKEVYYTRSRIEGVVNAIILATILALLILPIYLLYHLVTTLGTSRTDAPCIGILLVATLCFSAALSIFTRARRHEILAAAAAYCAVLVVFLGNVPQMANTKH